MDIYEVRKQNAQGIVDTQFNGVKARFADAIKTNHVVVNRWFAIGKTQRRNIGSNSARKIEDLLSLPSGWLDKLHENLNDLETDPKRQTALRIASGETHPIPLTQSATIDQRLRMTFISAVKGTLMLLSTDPDAYAIQLIGHNPTIWLHSNWMIVVEPNTPVSADECALLHLTTGEQILRLIVHVGEHLVMVRNPVTGEQEPYERGQIAKMEYAYIGIPPSKLVQE